MSMLMRLAALGGAVTKVQDVFATSLYAGNGAARSITNAIDLSGKGGLVWIKQRDGGFNYSHVLVDTVRGAPYLKTNTTDAQTTEPVPPVSAFSSTGFNLAAPTSTGAANSSGVNYVAWTFREAPKFFDVVQYIGDGTNNRSIPHALGQEPGMIAIKRVSDTSNWGVYHRSLGLNKWLLLNSTAAASTATTAGDFASVNSNDFVLYPSTRDSGFTANAAGVTYIAYLFAHDTSSSGLIQCGSFTTDGSGNASVTLGMEPQYVICKRTDAGSDWRILDIARSWSATAGKTLVANTSGAESSEFNGTFQFYPSATGFVLNNAGIGSNAAFIYVAIRKPS